METNRASFPSRSPFKDKLPIKISDLSEDSAPEYEKDDEDFPDRMITSEDQSSRSADFARDQNNTDKSSSGELLRDEI